MSQGKTATIAKRRVDVYLDSIDQRGAWVEAAKARGVSLSEWVQGVVERARVGEDIERAREQFRQELVALREELAALRERNRHYEIVVQKLEKELREERSRQFLPEGRGIRRYDRDLIELLRGRGGSAPRVVTSDEIFATLKVDPLREPDTARGLALQLERLGDMGLVQRVRGGWRWVT